MRILFYTVNLNNYDKIMDVTKARTLRWNDSYICVTDNKEDALSRSWGAHVVDIPNHIKNNKNEILDLTRYFKMNPNIVHNSKNQWNSPCDIEVYLDANKYFIAYSKIIQLCEKLWYSDKEMLIATHWGRTTVKEECDAVINCGKSTREQVDTEYQYLIDNGFKDDVGLYCASIEIRKTNSKPLKEMLSMWWDMYKISPTKRDQITLPYCLWKCNMLDKIITIESKELMNYFRHMPHRG